MTLVLFDFDGTLTNKDSLNEFLKYSFPRNKYLLNMMRFLPYFLMWKLKIIPNDKAKQHLFSIFFKNMDENIFKKIAKNYSLEKLDSIILKERFDILKKHQRNGDRVIIVSASIKCWLESWCKKNDIELISTELEFINSKITGKFKTKNNYGQEKVNRIKKYLNIKDYKQIYAYGDSKGDLEMLSLANKAIKY